MYKLNNDILVEEMLKDESLEDFVSYNDFDRQILFEMTGCYDNDGEFLIEYSSLEDKIQDYKNQFTYDPEIISRTMMEYRSEFINELDKNLIDCLQKAGLKDYNDKTLLVVFEKMYYMDSGNSDSIDHSDIFIFENKEELDKYLEIFKKAIDSKNAFNFDNLEISFEEQIEFYYQVLNLKNIFDYLHFRLCDFTINFSRNNDYKLYIKDLYFLDNYFFDSNDLNKLLKKFEEEFEGFDIEINIEDSGMRDIEIEIQSDEEWDDITFESHEIKEKLKNNDFKIRSCFDIEEDEDIENKEEWIKVIPIEIREKNNKVIGYGYKK